MSKPPLTCPETSALSLGTQTFPPGQPEEQQEKPSGQCPFTRHRRYGREEEAFSSHCD